MTHQTSTPVSTDPADHVRTFTERADRFTALVDGVGDAWDAPTPCDGWTVRAVVEHVIGSQRDFLARQDLDPGAEPDLTAPAAAWRAHRAHVDRVLADPDVAAREYDSFFGPSTIGATMADFYGWDMVVHGSDVVRGLGQRWTISDEEAAALHATADGWGDALYSEGVCAPAVEVGEDASAADRLLARLGRDPHWRPA